MKSATILRIHSIISSALDLAVRYEWAERNVAKNASPPHPRKREPDPQARAAVAETGLNAEQRDAVVMMLTAAAATTVLIPPAGAGKSHTMAEFARLWTSFTGRRVIGLTTSTNAARVLEHEGLGESYNIAEFLGKTEGTDELRRPVPPHQNDVLVLDEASQLSTTDLSRRVQARLIQLGTVGHPQAALSDGNQAGPGRRGARCRVASIELARDG